VSALDHGATMEQVEAAILGSPEYAQRAGGSDSAFLQSLYHDVLGRALDATGAAAWGTSLAQGASHAAVALQILTSSEARQDLVAQDYRAFLHRPSDPAGLAFWLGQLQTGTRDDAVTAGFLGSDEFFKSL